MVELRRRRPTKAIATKKLIGKVDDLRPTTPLVVAALNRYQDRRRRRPARIAGETGAVARGVVASVGLDYVELGRITGHMVARVLNGEKPGDIDAVIAYKVLTDFKVVVNKKAAAAMGVEVPESVLARATEIIE